MASFPIVVSRVLGRYEDMSGQAPFDEVGDTGFEPAGSVSSIDEEAARWLVRLTSGEATDEERAAFAHWRDASVEHQAALCRLRGLWVGLGALLPAPATVSVPPLAPPPPPPPLSSSLHPLSIRAVRRRRVRLWAMAASLLLVGAMAFQVLSPWRYDQVTGTGEQREVQLAEGSTMVLDADTKLNARLRPAQREVTLVSGQAYFDVSADAARPFVVRAGASEVRVLGTRFAVRHVGDGIQVSVVEGRVQVRRGESMVQLEAGQGVSVKGAHIADVVNIDATRELAWREGRLIVENLTFGEIVRRLAPYHPGVLMVANPQLENRRFNAVIELQRIDDWLTGLEQAAAVHVTRLGPVTLLH